MFDHFPPTHRHQDQTRAGIDNAIPLPIRTRQLLLIAPCTLPMRAATHASLHHFYVTLLGLLCTHSSPDGLRFRHEQAELFLAAAPPADPESRPLGILIHDFGTALKILTAHDIPYTLEHGTNLTRTAYLLDPARNPIAFHQVRPF